MRQELVETLYHVLWELVHVFFDHRGLLEGREARADARRRRLELPLPVPRPRARTTSRRWSATCARSVLAKAAEIGELRAQTLRENREALEARPRRRCAPLLDGGRPPAGARQRRLGHRRDGRRSPTSATPPDAAWPPRRALDLTEDPAILTAIANDIGVEDIFARQVIAHGRDGDALLAISTSGNSANVIAALAEARRRGLRTIAMVGYDGGRILADALADHVIVTRSEHIPRIQEAQASAYHVLRELVEAMSVAVRRRRARPRRRAPCRASASGPTSTGWPPSWASAGRVLNDSEGVVVEAEADAETLERFLERLAAEAPPLAVVERRRRTPTSRPRATRGFAIAREPRRRAGRRAGARRRRDVRRLPGRAAPTRPTAATATRSSTAPTAGRGSRSCAASPTTGR